MGIVARAIKIANDVLISIKVRSEWTDIMASIRNGDFYGTRRN